MSATLDSRFNRSIVSFILVLSFSVCIAPAYAQPPVARGPQGQIESPFAKVYEKVAPAVVKIDVETSVTQSQMIDPRRQFRDIPQQQQQQRKRTLPGVGSGVIVDREGHVLTNNHVVAGANNIKVVVNDDETYDAEVVGKDPETDLAVIKMKLNGKTLPASSVAELGNSDDLKPGDYAIAIGNPLGLDRTITVGVVSAIGRTGLPIQGGGPTQYQDFIQTDAQINPGNSGGALCDINGMVIGINDMYTAQYAGIGFAIPINLAKTVMTKLIATGKVDRGFLGIKGKDVNKGTKDALDLPTAEGVLVDMVVTNSPAEKFGLKVGDVILTIDGQKVKNWNDFSFKVAARNPGDTVNLDVIQEGSKKTIQVKLANRTDYADVNVPAGAVGESSWRGIHVVNVDNEQYRNYVHENVKSGVLVVNIDDNSPAAASQLREGDIITEISIQRTKKTIKNVQDFDAFKQQYKDSKRTMLVYRTQVSANGMVIKGFVTIDAE